MKKYLEPKVIILEVSLADVLGVSEPGDSGKGDVFGDQDWYGNGI